MPQDILKYEAKFALGLSARKIVFYGIGVVLALIGTLNIAPKFDLNITGRIIVGVICGFPFFFWGTIKPFGQNLEKVIIPFLVDNFLTSSVRKKEVHDEDYEKYTQIRKSTNKKKEDYAKKSKEYKGIV